MSQRTLSGILVAVVAAGAGALASLLLGSLLIARDPQLQAAEQQYRKLNPAEARRLESTFRQLQKSPQEKQRIRDIHRAVSTNPELDTNLQQLYAWWTTRSDAQRADLRELHSNTELWVAAVQNQYAESTSGGRIELRVPPRPGRGGPEGPPAVYVSREQIDRFLQDAVPDSELASDESRLLQAVDAADQSLIRVLITARHMFPVRQTGRPIDPDAILQVYQSATEHLFPEEAAGRRAEGPREVMRALGLLRSIKDHLSADFLKRHAVSEEMLEEQFAGLDSSARLEFMSSDPRDAARSLQVQQIASEESSTAGLLADWLDEFDRRSAGAYQRLRSEMRGGGPGERPDDRRRRGPGGRGIEGFFRSLPGARGPGADRSGSGEPGNGRQRNGTPDENGPFGRPPGNRSPGDRGPGDGRPGRPPGFPAP